MKKYHNISPPYFRVWVLFSHRAFAILPGWVLVDICSFIFHIAHIWCLSDHKIVENGTRSINSKNYHNFFSHFVEYGYRSPIQNLINFTGEYCLYMLISILHYSDSVCVWTHNSRKLDLASKKCRIATIFFFHFVDYGFCCTI